MKRKLVCRWHHFQRQWNKSGKENNEDGANEYVVCAVCAPANSKQNNNRRGKKQCVGWMQNCSSY